MAGEPPTFTAETLADRLGGRLAGNGRVRVSGIAPLDEAGPDQVTYVADPAHEARWPASAAGVVVVSHRLGDLAFDRDRQAVITVADAELASAVLLDLFLPPSCLPEPGAHPTAWVHESVTLGPEVRIGPHVSIDRECVIEERVVLHSGVRLYDGVTIGGGSVLHANTVVRSRCRIGRRVILHQNVSVGADGFGYRPAPDRPGLVKMPHLGTVEIGDDVEIGAGSCVDRGKMEATVIGEGTKIDNLVQIGHNCHIGRHCVVAALTGLGGSVEIGDGVQVGGMVGVSDHLRIGPGARLAGKSAVTRDVPAGETWLGYPAAPISQALRQWAAIRKLPGLIRAGGEQPAASPPSGSAPDARDAPASGR